MDRLPAVPWVREGELKWRLGTGCQSKISSESAKMVGKGWEGKGGGDVKQHRGEPQTGEETGQGRCTPSVNDKARFALGTGEPGELK